MTDKQLAFISEYTKDFNATQAAIRAGYSPKTAYSIGQELLRKPEIQKAMNEVKENLIADRDERLRFWTSTMRDENEDMKHRLRASELLGKAQSDFTEKIETNQNVKVNTLADLILEAYNENR
ncbi:MAG: terminase small subunit [Synergistaceae bacterium]|nr:terminase small subunit [Synergistaceae bacterium]